MVIPYKQQCGERSTKTDSPFCWASLAALRNIRDRFGTQASPSLSVYLALCSMAAIQRKQTFTCTISQVAGHAGLRYRKCHQVILELERAGLIGIKRNGGAKSRTAGAANTYTLLTQSRTSGEPRHVVPATSAPNAGHLGTFGMSKSADSIKEE